MNKLILPSPRFRQLENDVIQSFLKPSDKPFASGTHTNNHLDLGYDDIPRHNPLKRRLAVFTTALILESGVPLHFIATVPTGADGWGDVVAERINNQDTARIKSVKVGSRKFANNDESSQRISALRCKYAKPSGVVIDDATTDGGTTEAYADFLSSQGLEVNLVLSLFFRGRPGNLQSKYKRAALLARYIPTALDWGEFEETGEVTELAAQL